jgi:predicted small lipoprotein YifL
MAVKFITRLIVPALLAALAAACGNKGDLVLPDAEPARVIPPEQDVSRN